MSDCLFCKIANGEIPTNFTRMTSWLPDINPHPYPRARCSQEALREHHRQRARRDALPPSRMP